MLHAGAEWMNEWIRSKLQNTVWVPFGKRDQRGSRGQYQTETRLPPAEACWPGPSLRRRAGDGPDKGRELAGKSGAGRERRPLAFLRLQLPGREGAAGGRGMSPVDHPRRRGRGAERWGLPGRFIWGIRLRVTARRTSGCAEPRGSELKAKVICPLRQRQGAP